MKEADFFILIERLMEISIGVITILAFKMKMGSSGNQNKIIQDLINRVEKKERENEDLRMKKHILEIRHEHATNECKQKHLH